jgi:hypothetical protein
LTRVSHGIRAEHASEPVAAAEFGEDEIAIRAERFAQCGDLNRHYNVWPQAAEELLSWDEQAVGLQEGQKEIESARAELDRNTVGEQLPLAQQDAETAEFESRVGGCGVRPVGAP